MKKFFEYLFTIVILILVLNLVAGCATTDQPGKDETVYDFFGETQITVPGRVQPFVGMGVTKTDGPILIRFRSMAKQDMVYIHSCARFEFYRKVDANWFGGAGKEFPYTYRPVAEEMEGSCPVFFEAYDMAGLTDWGMVAFRSDQKLPAKSTCNGVGWDFAGLTVCQVKAETAQRIWFTVPIDDYNADPSCNIERLSPTEFRFSPSLGFCNASFNAGEEFHDLIAVGVKRPLLRE